MNILRRASIVLLTSLYSAYSQVPVADESQLPRIPATEPKDVLDTFQVRPGFGLHLVAHEPEVVDPIAMAFDEDGGLYVVEMRGYSERREDALGRIRYLQDQDGDGFFESSSVFKDGLKWPTGIVCYKGGVFVGATPDLSYFKDTDGDGISDEERLIFTGFGNARPELNMQALFNSFRWGPDNRIWGATASSGGTVIRPSLPGMQPVALRGADFSFDPEKLDLRPENGTLQYGLSFDSFGRRFVCSNSRHAVWVAYERRHALPNPYYDLPSALVDIPDDGAAATVYRISPDEPWRIVRTRWRVSGVARGMVEGGGRVSGYFTSASGIQAYWGKAYGMDFYNNLFVGDVGSNLVHRKSLRQRDGKIQPVATRPEGEKQTEFIRSRDNWFRPVSFATGPDGCLYICDMYREVIEHPWSLPQGIKKHLDLNSGYDRGRIYRVEPSGFKRPATPRLSKASDSELVRLAERSDTDWLQTTARRLLFERGRALAPKQALAPFPSELKQERSLIDQLPVWRDDPWREAAILNSLREKDAIQDAWRHPALKVAPRFEAALAKLSGRTGDRSLIQWVARRIATHLPSSQTLALLEGLKEGMSYARADWNQVERQESIVSFFDKARSIAAGVEAALDDRITALRHLALQSGRQNESLLRDIIANTSSPEPLVTEAARGVHSLPFLVEQIGRLTPEAKRFALDQTIKDPANARRLLDALADGAVAMESIPAEILDKLRGHANARIAERAKQVLPEIENRADAIARYQPALSREGYPDSGETVFKKACIQCHLSPDGEGIVFGPPATTFKTAGKASILGNVLEPNREVAPQYQAFEFILQTGESLIGMIASEDGRTVTLLLPGGIEKTFPRSQVQSTRGLGKSLMPEGLEQTLSIQEVVDLLAYLTK